MSTMISIIMSVYNCESTLREALDSVLAQTYHNWEFVICNDASTDGTQQILDEYEQKYPDRFIILKNDENRYLSYSLNRCLSCANGEYIARMDGDDISEPTRLETELMYLQQHPDCDLVGCAMRRFSKENGLADVVEKPLHPTKFDLRKEPTFNHATILTYKKVYDQLGGYTVSKRTRRGQDYDLWFRFFAAGFSGDNLAEPLYLVREDINAIKRRTFRVRWNTFRTMQIGYKLLGFPKVWLVKEFLIMIGKSLVPFRLIQAYRCWQAKHTA